MKAYSEYSLNEKLSLQGETVYNSIRLEAAKRGVKPPVSLPERLKSEAYTGYTPPVEGLRVWEIDTGNNYGHRIGYLTPELARKALEGMVILGSIYSSKGSYDGIKTDVAPAVRETVLVNPNARRGIPEEVSLYPDDPDADQFEAIRQECFDDFHRIHQEAHDRKARRLRWLEYQKMAEGNRDVALRFWTAANEGEIPTEEGTEVTL